MPVHVTQVPFLADGHETIGVISPLALQCSHLGTWYFLAWSSAEVIRRIRLHFGQKCHLGKRPIETEGESSLADGVLIGRCSLSSRRLSGIRRRPSVGQRLMSVTTNDSGPMSMIAPTPKGLTSWPWRMVLLTAMSGLLHGQEDHVGIDAPHRSHGLAIAKYFSRPEVTDERGRELPARRNVG